MIKYILALTSILIYSCSNSQDNNTNTSLGTRGEFAALTTNGLMYSESDMKALRFVVDSLNIKHKTCDNNKTYLSKKQGHFSYVEFESKNNNLKEIIKEIKAGADYSTLVKKYTAFIADKGINNLVVLAGLDEEKGNTLTYLVQDSDGGFDNLYIDDENKIDQKRLLNGWIYSYSPKDKYSSEYSLTCKFFYNDWTQNPIPTNYGQFINYVDCMIDTSSSVFLTNEYEGGWSWQEDSLKGFTGLGKLADYINKKAGLPPNKKKVFKLNEFQFTYASTLIKDKEFLEILSSTIDLYVENKTAEHNLESLAEEARLFDKALLMKRCYQVMGSCSQDGRPREHARNIAILSAQSHSWNIFLRAHLDIMNDRFSRASDGSYAWGKRETYLKELEELNLNVLDLMIGLTLRADNISSNHYYGTIWRLGKALTESKDRNLFEQQVTNIIKDGSLDEFNRSLLFLLYTNYINHLADIEGKKKLDELFSNVQSFPDFIQERIKKIAEKS